MLNILNLRLKFKLRCHIIIFNRITTTVFIKRFLLFYCYSKNSNNRNLKNSTIVYFIIFYTLYNIQDI